MHYSPIAWLGFHLFVLFCLAIDLFLLHKNRHTLSLKKATFLSVFWITVALAFNVFIYMHGGTHDAIAFFTGYLVEKSLSIDNLFLFLMIFLHFKVPPLQQRRVLFWGILGVLVFRVILVLVGLSLINRFHFLLYLLGALLIYSGIQIFLQKKRKKNPSENWLFHSLKKILPVKDAYQGGEFFILDRGKWKATRLFLVLLLIECTDIVLAIDSVPAVFAITQNPFIVYTSNILAILGLRSLYFVLSSALDRLAYLKWGLAAILIFVGSKMVFVDLITISPLQSLSIIASILIITLLCSLKKMGFSKYH